MSRRTADPAEHGAPGAVPQGQETSGSRRNTGAASPSAALEALNRVATVLGELDTAREQLVASLEREGAVLGRAFDAINAGDTPALKVLVARVLAERPEDHLRRLVEAAATPVPSVAHPLFDLLVELAHARFRAFAELTEALLFDGTAPAPVTATALRTLATVMEEGAGQLLIDALDHPATEIVATALEALADLDLEEAAPAVEALLDDRRKLSAPLGESGELATLGELAKDTYAYLTRA